MYSDELRDIIGVEETENLEQELGKDRLAELLSVLTVREVVQFRNRLWDHYGRKDGLHILKDIPVDEILKDML